MHIPYSLLEQSLQLSLEQFKSVLKEYEASATDLPYDVRQIMREVHARLFDPALNVRYACGQRGLANHNVSSRFRLHMGVGIREYIEWQRLDAAKLLLRTTDADVYRIAEAVGYTYVESFARAFHRVVGCTPLQYRARREKAPYER